MTDVMEDGAVCGVDGCSVPSISASLQNAKAVEIRAVHDLTIVSDVICPWCFVAFQKIRLVEIFAKP